MGHITVSDGFAIWQLIVYIVALPISIWVAARHGFLKSSGWIFLAIFCTIRIISSASQLASISSSSETPVTISLITGLLGLSPLLLATLGILSRVYYSMLKSPWNIFFSLAIVRIVQTPAAIALILCIVGATSADDPSQIDDQGTIKAGTILFLIVFILICILAVGAFIGLRTTRRGEARLLGIVAMSLPLLLIRIIYSFAAIFSDDENFSLANTSTKAALINLFMVRIEEMVVVGIYLWGGLRQEAVPRQDDGTERSTAERMRYRAERGDFGSGKLGMVSLAAHGVFEMFSRGGAEEESRDAETGRTRKRANHK